VTLIAETLVLTIALMIAAWASSARRATCLRPGPRRADAAPGTPGVGGVPGTVPGSVPGTVPGPTPAVMHS